MTNFPVLRATHKKGLKINYISKKDIPESLIEKRKTEAGYINISNSALTATDLVQFEKRAGGLNRVSNILNELMEELQPIDFSRELLRHVPTTVSQRLGYILEFICHNQLLADGLYEALADNRQQLFRTPLKVSADSKGYTSENRWKVIVNTEIEVDE